MSLAPTGRDSWDGAEESRPVGAYDQFDHVDSQGCALGFRIAHLRCYAAFLLLVFVGCDGQWGGGNANNSNTNASVGETPAIRVTTVRPERKDLVRRTRQPGQVDAFRRAPLFAKVPGYVERFTRDIGDDVRGPRYDDDENLIERGELLAELSIPELDEQIREKEAVVGLKRAEIDQARANIKVAEAEVKTAKARLEQALAEVDRTTHDQEKWKSEYERVVKLTENRSVNTKVVDATRNEFQASQAASRDAAAKVDAANAAIAESEAYVEKAVADEVAAHERRRVAEADLAQTRALAEYRRIEAPFDGTISERNLDVGHFVQPADQAQTKPLFVVVQTDVVRVFVDVPEMEATLVDRGDRATIRVQSLSGRDFTGEVTRTAWALDSTSSSRTLRTEIDVPNPDGVLRAGMYVYATVVLDERHEALSLPLTAVRRHEGNASCFCVEDGSLVEKPLEAGLSDGTDVEIVSGLGGDENVVQKVTPALAGGQRAEATPAEKGK
ncbi:MAG TPA: efflux RND transporter periplasmic adaptor subunit [Pirellulales bacterium]|nr:efflux RND transporter periplasmic adaptor subunit [Pirellulales bacterium]